MIKFWHDNQSFDERENRLMNCLFQAHFDCTFRPNCSTVALQNAGFGSKHLVNGYIAALACLGETHGPIEEAYDVLKGEDILQEGIVPGWGNSFIKGQVDPAFQRVDEFIEQNYPSISNRLREITDTLHVRGKEVFPNPAAYTAAVAIILGMPRHLAPMLFVNARLMAWGMVFHNTISQPVPKQQKEPA